METSSLFSLGTFEGLATLVASEPKIAIARIVLILLGFLFIYLGRKGVLEALIMVPMGLGMSVVNAGVLFWDKHANVQGTLNLNALAGGTGQPLEQAADVVHWLQIDWLQPVYSLMFSNGLVACLVFMGIGVLLDVGFVMARPFQSMFLALCAELGTVLTFPLAQAVGFTPGQSAAIATIGGADGPMILFTSLILAKDLFVPITVVAYLYLGLTYGGYPYIIKLLVPKHIRGIKMPPEQIPHISSGEKVMFAVLACTILSLLFPVAAPLFLSLFIGVIVRESDLPNFRQLFEGPFLYAATFLLGLVLGILCEASTLLNPAVIKLLLLGILALLLSGIGGLLGGYVLYFASGKKYNPVIGIAGVSCVPTTAKVAQKEVAYANPSSIVLPHALGANVSGVITSAILASIFISQLR